jgi:hypothetical protein
MPASRRACSLAFVAVAVVAALVLAVALWAVL